MAVTQRGRRTRYDNIAAGSATGPERTFTDTVTKVEIHGGGYRTSRSNAEEHHSNVAAGVSVSEQGQGAVVGGELPEQVVQAGVTNTEELLG